MALWLLFLELTAAVRAVWRIGVPHIEPAVAMRAPVEYGRNDQPDKADSHGKRTKQDIRHFEKQHGNHKADENKAADIE